MSRYNLLDEKWIPTACSGYVSLLDVFENNEIRGLGGNPVERIALTKLLLAIVQTAVPIKDERAFNALSASQVSEMTREYLSSRREAFYLYGDRPFLQMAALSKFESKDLSNLQPEISSGNTALYTDFQRTRRNSDRDKALLVVSQMSMAIGGMKTDNSIVLSKTYTGKRKSCGKVTTSLPGPGVGYQGALHSFVTKPTLIETLMVNLFTQAELKQIGIYEKGLGVPPWDSVVVNEDCRSAKALRKTYMGRLVPMNRFMLLTDEGVVYTEGVKHLSHKDMMFDPSATVFNVKKDVKMVWANPDKKPWRDVTAMLSFIEQQKSVTTCLQLKYGLRKALAMSEDVGIWSGGMRISSKSGKQYMSGTDDYVQSSLTLDKTTLNELWFESYKNEIEELNKLSSALYSGVKSYNEEFNRSFELPAGNATREFWKLCDRYSQELVDSCDDAVAMASLRKTYVKQVNAIFNKICPKESGRQLKAWITSKPMLAGYLNGQK
ncbi:type I-E CRISPR-associated protein Cse1/CasA [Vibrio barjaei]|uniref:type I-E CRISPR-associated protein Cse1/CasA n=1 Tax=Vibrio barjaei TaxID=1676683 RepID=UPI00228407C8|nr:type I-E CRISPR-associated protein Cse1/CasA [Vibrio barjaei]MCY9874530.1 type I-E CRISPR-associated protein Cse1/CasA [Vibrio barjaei]